jgi:SpoVK/Ycf46/Vps4 family AAA+-type ATPase
MKQFIVMEEIKDDMILSNQLMKEILSKAKAMAPLIVFLDEAIND